MKRFEVVLSSCLLLARTGSTGEGGLGWVQFELVLLSRHDVSQATGSRCA